MSYGLVFGGSHLYLALRDEDGMVPVRSRWRFVGTVALVLSLWSAAFLVGDARIAGVSLRSAIGWISVAVLGAYVLLEARDGYRQSRAEP